jgi:hypothetical protein
MSRRSLVSRGLDATQATATNREIRGCEIYCAWDGLSVQKSASNPDDVWVQDRMFGIPLTFKETYQRVFFSVTIPQIELQVPDGAAGKWPVQITFIDSIRGLSPRLSVFGLPNEDSMIMTAVGDFPAGEFNFGMEIYASQNEPVDQFYFSVSDAQMQVIVGQVVEESQCVWGGHGG